MTSQAPKSMAAVYGSTTSVGRGSTASASSLPTSPSDYLTGPPPGQAPAGPKLWLPKQLVNQLGYGGCVVIYTLVWMARGKTEVDASERHLTILLLMWDLHFIKRCLECLFVHKWSDTRNPLGMALGEWVYYWGLALFVAFSVNSPWGTFRPREDYPTAGEFYPFVVLFFVAVIGNGLSHIALRRHRPNRKLLYPSGPLFCLVSCPHYSFEVLTWLSFMAASQTYAAALMALATLIVLAIYSRERHLSYKKTFNGEEGRDKYPTIRRALIPFVY